MAAKVESTTRRVPTQDRSRQRVERMLDAAAEVFAQVGVEAATTEAIAAKAGTSIGSLYQFFPNKKALFYAIVSRYTERVRAVFDSIVAPTGKSWIELLDYGIDALDEFHRTDPGFRAILRNWSSGEFLEADDAINTEFARRIDALLANQAPALTPSHRAVVAEIVVETTSAMLILSARRDATHGARVIAEGKVMLHRYLEPYAAMKPVRRRRSAADKSARRDG
jgi:AcrR family transcriptional regulator